MSDPATDRILAKAAEDVQRRNLQAVVADTRDTRTIAARAETIAVKNAADVGVLRERFDQQTNIALARALERLHALEGRIAALEEEVRSGTDH